MAQLNDTQKAFLREGHLAVVTTLRADGSPHSTPVWIDCDGEDVVFNTARGRAKEQCPSILPLCPMGMAERTPQAILHNPLE